MLNSVKSSSIEISEWFYSDLIQPEKHLFAIGDVHGNVNAMNSLMKSMHKFEDDESELVFLGDLINRGHDSLGCLIAAAHNDDEIFSGKKKLILGNHEIYMIYSSLDASDSIKIFDMWRHCGGESFIDEFAHKNSTLKSIKTDIAFAVARRLGHPTDVNVGLEIVNSIWNAPLYHINGNLFMIHGGIERSIERHMIPDWCSKEKVLEDPIRPNSPINLQNDFVDYFGEFSCGYTIIHGHSPECIFGVPDWKAKTNSKPPGIYNHVLKGHRLGLDGFYATGGVAGAEFLPGKYRIFWAPIDQKYIP